jgi:hypothetical protein
MGALAGIPAAVADCLTGQAEDDVVTVIPDQSEDGIGRLRGQLAR